MSGMILKTRKDVISATLNYGSHMYWRLLGRTGAERGSLAEKAIYAVHNDRWDCRV